MQLKENKTEKTIKDTFLTPNYMIKSKFTLDSYWN